jgi:hypothetical protein
MSSSIEETRAARCSAAEAAAVVRPHRRFLAARDKTRVGARRNTCANVGPQHKQWQNFTPRRSSSSIYVPRAEERRVLVCISPRRSRVARRRDGVLYRKQSPSVATTSDAAVLFAATRRVSRYTPPPLPPHRLTLWRRTAAPLVFPIGWTNGRPGRGGSGGGQPVAERPPFVECPMDAVMFQSLERISQLRFELDSRPTKHER